MLDSIINIMMTFQLDSNLMLIHLDSNIIMTFQLDSNTGLMKFQQDSYYAENTMSVRTLHFL